MGGFARLNGVPLEPEAYVGSGGSNGGLTALLVSNVTGTATGADTNETDLWTYDLRANTLNADGKAVRVKVWGRFAGNGNNKTLKAYFGTQTVLDTGALAQNGGAWEITFTVVRTGAATETFVATVWRNAAAAGVNGNDTLTQDTAAAITIKVTGTNGTATASDITKQGAMLEVLYGAE